MATVEASRRTAEENIPANTSPTRQRVHSFGVLCGMHSLARRACIGTFSPPVLGRA